MRLDTTTLSFVFGSTPPADSDFYLTLRPDGNEDRSPDLPVDGETPEGLPVPVKSRLLYYVNKITNVYRLCIPPSVVPEYWPLLTERVIQGFRTATR